MEDKAKNKFKTFSIFKELVFQNMQGTLFKTTIKSHEQIYGRIL